MKRVAIFIDGSNLYKGLVQHLGSDYRLNFVEFITLLTAGRKLLRAYYYNAPLPPGDPAAKAHQSFLNYLKRVPYVTVRLGRLERRADGFVEKGVDIQIAVDMLRLAFVNAYDIAVLDRDIPGPTGASRWRTPPSTPSPPTGWPSRRTTSTPWTTSPGSASGPR